MDFVVVINDRNMKISPITKSWQGQRLRMAIKRTNADQNALAENKAKSNRRKRWNAIAGKWDDKLLSDESRLMDLLFGSKQED